MKESIRIAKLFEDLYDGNPWIDVTIMPHLRKLTGKQASKRIYTDWNTIWEITQHMMGWRANVLQRIQGQVVKTPSHNYIFPVADTSEAAWQSTLKQFEKTQRDWITFLKKFKSPDFQKKYPSNHLTYYEHMHGILQHDAYHLGQIVIMMKRV